MLESQLLKYLYENPFVLAPMAGITDCAFRSFMRDMGCGVVVTELISANGLAYQSERTKKIMSFTHSQRPVGIQIFGEELSHLSLAAKMSEDLGADFVDINFGCPVPKVVKKGAGSAALKDLVQLGKVIHSVKSSVSIPVTIKIRTGWDHESRNSVEVCKVAKEEGVTWVAIHGRTRAAGYSGKADWDYITYVKSQSPIPVLGNGDLVSPALAVDRLKSSGCDGVLIGRGCLKNPWIFKESLQLLKSGQQSNVDKNFESLFDSLHGYLEEQFDDRITTLQLKKLAAWYSSGYPDSGKFRKNLFSFKEKDSILFEIKSFFNSLKHIEQADTSDEAFLMGGHG